MTSDKLGRSSKDEFLSACKKDICRDGIEELLGWVEESGFFYAPASIRFHGNHKHGLLEHPLNAYKALKKLVKQHEGVEVPDETLAISTLFHDICRANLHVAGSRNVKDEQTGQWHKGTIYEHDDQLPVGRGEESVIILPQYMALTDDEIHAICFHIGGFDSAIKGGDGSTSKAYEPCPLVMLLHLADMTASYLMENRNAR